MFCYSCYDNKKSAKEGYQMPVHEAEDRTSTDLPATEENARDCDRGHFTRNGGE